MGAPLQADFAASVGDLSVQPPGEVQNLTTIQVPSMSPSPLPATPMSTKSLRSKCPQKHSQTFGQRLLKVEALAQATHERVKANRAFIIEASDRAQLEANSVKKDNQRLIREAGLGNFKAPGFEKMQSVSERLRLIDEAARANAKQIKERRELLVHVAEEEEQRRKWEAKMKATSKTLLVDSPTGKAKSWQDLKRERLRGLRPIRGPDATERMESSLTTLRELLPGCAVDLEWAEERLAAQRARQPSDAGVAALSPDSQAPSPVTSPHSRAVLERGEAAKQPLGQAAAAVRPLPDLVKKSASAPSLSRGTRPLMPKPGHTKLYPSMMERYRVIEGVARQNAATIESLRL